MRSRHIVLLLVVVIALASILAGCDMIGGAPVSIDQRVKSFQSDLNSTTRTQAYLNFHPTETADYDALKDGITITTLFPLPDGTGSSYTLTDTDKTHPSSGVLVLVTGGPTSYGGPRNLKLVMDTTGVSDYRIVSLSMDDGAGNYPPIPQIK